MFFTFTQAAGSVTDHQNKVCINGDRIVSFKASARNTTHLCVTTETGNINYFVTETEETIKGMLNSGCTTAESFVQLLHDTTTENPSRERHMTRDTTEGRRETAQERADRIQRSLRDFLGNPGPGHHPSRGPR
jgi:hypothetical protein